MPLCIQCTSLVSRAQCNESMPAIKVNSNSVIFKCCMSSSTVKKFGYSVIVVYALAKSLRNNDSAKPITTAARTKTSSFFAIAVCTTS
mmetsp:Transcript_19102/g.31359  ORF Transcript_19102/g.31359 Transcript_19102/m.31359 type:complete len:88 (+) Transcript_19102:407-670(+)